MQEAEGYRNQQFHLAQGQGQQIKSQAQTFKTERIQEALGDANQFEKRLKAYQNSKRVTKSRLYLETMEQILPKMKRVVVDE